MAVGTPRRRMLGIAWGLLSMLVLVACTTTIPGQAVAADNRGPLTTAPPTPTTATRPTPDIVAAPPVGPGRQLEAHRIAGSTALVQTAFPERTTSCSPYGAFVTATDVENAYFPPGTAAQILDDYGFVTAWGQCAQDAGGLSTLALSIEVSDPLSAVSAVRELADASAASAPDREETTVFGGALAIVGSDGTNDDVEVWAPIGRMIAYTYHIAPAGQGLDTATRMIAEQAALLAGFVPTPQADVPNLPPDPMGLAPVTLDVPGTPDAISGPFDLESYLRIAIDPARERDLLTANGFTGMYTKQSSDGTLIYAVALYAFPTSMQTNAVYNGFAELETSAFGGTKFQLPAIPEAPCFFFDYGTPGAPSFYQRCYVGFGSYLAGVDVGGLATADDYGAMNNLLPAQRDLIDG